MGREQEIRAVEGCLATARLVTLTGTGGVGKTRLAIRVAEEVAGDYADGVWFVELAALSDPTLVPQAVASVLQMREQPDRPLTATLQESLRAKQLLLALDNCEHVIDACAQLAETLLRGCAHLRILATSRQSLGLTGEVTWRVPSLSLPAPEQGSRVEGQGSMDNGGRHPPLTLDPRPSTLLQYEAVRLFVERAAAVAPGFTLTERNAAAVVQVCCRLDGIPLALELAAARVKALPVEQIPALLDHPFRLLTGGGRTALPRHQTLRATIDWSYDLLSEAERSALRRLSVFAAGFQLEAAQAVCLDADHDEFAGLDLLTALVDKGLVVYEEQAGEVRYRLLETIRRYGWDRLAEAGETEVVRRRHRDWCLRLAERAAPELHGPDQAMWYERLEREYDNLRAALSGSVERGEVEVALRLGGALPWFWMARDHVSEGRKRLTEILALPGAQARTALRAKALDWAGHLADAQGDSVAARALLEESLTIQRALDDKKSIARSLRPLGQNAQNQGDYATARALFEESLAIQQALGDKREVAGLRIHLGDVVSIQGDYEAARALCEESLAFFRELGKKRGIAWSLQVLGRVARAQGDTATARGLLEESVALFKELGIRPATAVGLCALGDVVKDQGDLKGARSLYDESLAIGRVGDHKRLIAASLAGLGDVAAAEGNFPAERSLYQESLTISQETGDKRGVAICLEGLAGVAARQEPKERAARLFGAAEALREAIGAPLAPCARAGYERELAAARAGAGEPKFGAAWAEGCAMMLDEAVWTAMSDTCREKEGA